ncbi:MAG: hypothetical protein IVW51_00845 [Thermaceae bacterium]|nr:hypothetical protein [Thermaceae bacterium]
MSKTDDLVELLRQHKEKEAQTHVDLEAIRREWLGHLENLFKNVEDWLKAAVAGNLVELNRRQITLEEEFTGSYKAPLLELRFSDGTVSLRPIW